MKGTAYINGVIGSDFILLDLIRQIKQYKGLSEIEVVIDSPGGSVEVGQSIYSYLRSLSAAGTPVTTVAKKCWSISATIFMAGDSRIVEAGDDRVMIHMPWATAQGGSETLLEISNELKRMEDDFAQFYSIYTNIDETSIKQLLKNETFLSADEALEIGIATAVKQPLQAVAFYNNNDKEEEKIMTKTEKFLNALNTFFVTESESTVEINALIIADATGAEMNFSELIEGDEPQVRTDESAGSIAIDSEGKPIEGERVATDGSVWLFEKGELISITPVQEEVIEEEVAEVVAEVEEEIDFEAILKMFETKMNAQFNVENEKLKTEIVALKKMIGSPETIVEKTNNDFNKNDGLNESLKGLIALRK